MNHRCCGTIIESDVIFPAPSGDIYVKTASGTANTAKKSTISATTRVVLESMDKVRILAGRRYYKEDGKYFTGSGEFVTSKPDGLLKQILADVQSSLFDCAVSDKKAMLDKLSKANLINNRKYSATASYENDFASYVAGLLDIYYPAILPTPVGFRYIGFVRQSDGSAASSRVFSSRAALMAMSSIPTAISTKRRTFSMETFRRYH